MTATLYVVGPPAVGKSTLVSALLERYVSAGPVDVGHPPLVVEHLRLVADSAQPDGVYLGIRRDEFPGTDALSMGVLPHAEEWAQHAALPPLIVGEGDRLAHERFLAPLAERGQLVIVYLAASPKILAARRLERGSQQNETWATGRATRARNVAEAAERRGWDVVKVYASAPADTIAVRVRDELWRRSFPLA